MAHDSDQSICRTIRRCFAGAFQLRAPRSRPQRRRDRHRQLRRLPHRHSFHQQRLRHVALSDGAGARDRRESNRRRGGRHEVQARRSGRRRMPGRLVPQVRRVHRGTRTVLPGRLGPDLQRPRKGWEDSYPGRVLDEDRRRRVVHAQAPARDDPSKARPRSFAPASPPIRRCGTGRSERDRRSRSSGSAGSGTWASSSRRRWEPRSRS